MKRLLLLLLLPTLGICLTSCEDDYFIEDLEPEVVTEDASYITVTVTAESEALIDQGCSTDRRKYLVGVEGAQVKVKPLNEEQPLGELAGFTDGNGRVLFEELPAGQYNVSVSSRVGTSSQNVTTRLGEITRVAVRF